MAHLVSEFLNGELPEAIQSHFPTLSLEQVYGGIVFYLANREEVERDIFERGREEDDLIANQSALPAGLEQKLDRARSDAPSR